MTEDCKQEKLDGRFSTLIRRVVRMFEIWDFEFQIKIRETDFVKELGLNDWDRKIGLFRTISPLEFKSMEKILKLETKIVGLTETAKIQSCNLFLGTEPGFELEFIVHIASTSYGKKTYLSQTKKLIHFLVK